jgi:glycerol uptake facilitator-like aquaporin
LQAAVVADQNAKLSIFATRPAIYSPLYNFITEVMGTVALLLLVLLIEMQVRLLVVCDVLCLCGFSGTVSQLHHEVMGTVVLLIEMQVRPLWCVFCC